MKKLLILFSLISLVAACGGSKSTDGEKSGSNPYSTSETTTGIPEYDPHRGEGKWTAENVAVGASLDAAMATSGEKIQAVKCASCHKLTGERLVGPGWTGVTQRRSPEWIMKFITNTDPLIDQDPDVQAQLELCRGRMANPNLADAEARVHLEIVRK
jgi:cytochrome c553